MGDAVHHRERQRGSCRAHRVETEQAWPHAYPARWPDAIRRRMILALAPTRAAASKMDAYCRRLLVVVGSWTVVLPVAMVKRRSVLPVDTVSLCFAPRLVPRQHGVGATA